MNRRESSDSAVEFSAIGLPVMALVDAAGFWQGSVKDLLVALNAKSDALDRRDPEWPKGEKALAAALHRIDANLHAAGYDVRWRGKDPRTRRRILCITKKSKSSTVEFPTGEAKSAD